MLSRPCIALPRPSSTRAPAQRPAACWSDSQVCKLGVLKHQKSIQILEAKATGVQGVNFRLLSLTTVFNRYSATHKCQWSLVKLVKPVVCVKNKASIIALEVCKSFDCLCNRCCQQGLPNWLPSFRWAFCVLHPTHSFLLARLFGVSWLLSLLLCVKRIPFQRMFGSSLGWSRPIKSNAFVFGDPKVSHAVVSPRSALEAGASADGLQGRPQDSNARRPCAVWALRCGTAI